MPAVLPPEAYEAWLDPERPPGTLRPLLRPEGTPPFEAIRVGPSVNDPKNDTPACLTSSHLRTTAPASTVATGAATRVRRMPGNGPGTDVVEMAKNGKSSQEIIAELQRTWTVLPMQAANIVAMHEAGVPTEVLDYLQRAQIEEIRWRDRAWYGPAYGPYYGWGPCRYRGRWGC